MTEQGDWITAAEAAELLQTSRTTIYDMVRAGEVTSARWGAKGVKGLRISRASLEAFVARRTLQEAPRVTPRRGRRKGGAA